MKFQPEFRSSVSVDSCNEYMIHDTLRNGIRQIKPEIQENSLLQAHLEGYEKREEALKHEILEKTVGISASITLKMEKYLMQKVPSQLRFR